MGSCIVKEPIGVRGVMPRTLVIGACDGRGLADMLCREGVSATTFSPESIHELHPGNTNVAELYRDFTAAGLGGYLKVERTPLRARIAEHELIIVFPFFEYKTLYLDVETQSCFNPRCRPGGKAHVTLFSVMSSRLRPFDLDRDSYYARLAGALGALAREFATKKFIVLLPAYDRTLFGPDHRYNCPFVSNTFEDFDGMTQFGREFLPTELAAYSNVRCMSIEPVFRRMLETQGTEVRYIFPFFLPRGDGRPGFHRDIAHISDAALASLARAIIRLEMPSLAADAIAENDAPKPRNIDSAISAVEAARGCLRAGTLEGLANGIELALRYGVGDEVENEVTSSLQRLIESAPTEPNRVLLLHVWSAYSRNVPTKHGYLALESLIQFLLDKDLEYGAWKDFLRDAVVELSALVRVSQTSRGPADWSAVQSHAAVL